jgi:hypothetical protein
MKKTHGISNLKCIEAVPRSMPYHVVDRGGLYLLVTPAGGKLWRWRYRFEGKEKQMAFGKYPDISIAQARVLHAKARMLLATGIDPMTEKKNAKQQSKMKRSKEEFAVRTAFTEFIQGLLASGFDPILINKEIGKRRKLCQW